ncbi:hypothetical protein NO135_21875, partial [Clostridioides difficile]|nr:hypothetical protein [Clostridioides difficile]
FDVARLNPSDRRNYSFILIIRDRLIQRDIAHRPSFNDSSRFNHSSIGSLIRITPVIKYRFF